MSTFKLHYFIATILLFIIEVLIALFAHDKIIRPYFGDLLVVMLLYCFVKSFLNWPVLRTCWSVLLFAYLIETLQYFNFVYHLGLGNNFAWLDILAYTLGILLVLGIEWIKLLNHKSGTRKDEKLPLFI